MGFPSSDMEDRFNEYMAVVTRYPKAKRYFEDDNIPCQIEKGLYLGSVGAANMRITLKTLNVTHILSITGSFARFYPDDFVYKTLLVADSEDANIGNYFNECFTFIDEARARGGGILVHCFAGKSRSVSVIVAYLMFKNGKSFSEAMRYVKLKRPVASPNVGFRRQLLQYEGSLQDTTSTKNISGFLTVAWLKAMLADKVKKKSTEVEESSSSAAPLQAPSSSTSCGECSQGDEGKKVSEEPCKQGDKRKQGSSSPEALPSKRTQRIPSVALAGLPDLEDMPVKQSPIEIKKCRQELSLENKSHVPCAVPARRINDHISVFGTSPGEKSLYLDQSALSNITHMPIKENDTLSLESTKALIHQPTLRYTDQSVSLEQDNARARDAHAKRSKAEEVKDHAVKVACFVPDKAVSALRKELAQVRKELEKEKKKNREKDEAFKLGCKAGAQSLLCSFDNKKILSEPLIGRVRSFLQSQSFDTLLAAEDLVPDRLLADFFDALEINEDDLNVDEFSDLVRAQVGGPEAATPKPAGEEIPL